jgi:hypothetical protein
MLTKEVLDAWRIAALRGLGLTDAATLRVLDELADARATIGHLETTLQARNETIAELQRREAPPLALAVVEAAERHQSRPITDPLWPESYSALVDATFAFRARYPKP